MEPHIHVDKDKNDLVLAAIATKVSSKQSMIVPLEYCCKGMVLPLGWVGYPQDQDGFIYFSKMIHDRPVIEDSNTPNWNNYLKLLL